MIIEEFYTLHQQAIIQDIMTFVKIPTVLDSNRADAKAPFGKSIKEGLDWVLRRANDMGFETKNYDGYAGEVTVGNGEFIIGILAHSDVVAAGEGWETEPFLPVLKENRLYGRGSMDDKGPLISCLYVMKYLQENGKIPEGCALRMIIGTDEEEEWRDMEYYTSHADRMPDYAIVPDGYFPLIFCEKGLIDFDIHFLCQPNKQAPLQLESLTGGSGRNIVPGKAKCVLKGQPALYEAIKEKFKDQENLIVSVKEGKCIIRTEGKSTHAMSPEKGRNAISLLLQALGAIDAIESISHSEFIRWYNCYIGMEFDGKGLRWNFSDELSGNLTLNIGTIQDIDEQIMIEANLRYPASMAVEAVRDAMARALDKSAIQWEEKSWLPPVYIEPDTPFVKMLQQTYEQCTGDKEYKPFSVGGATYARAIPNAVAFGPLFPYEEELAHEPNEFLSLDSLEKMTVIYATALEKLIQLKDASK